MNRSRHLLPPLHPDLPVYLSIGHSWHRPTCTNVPFGPETLPPHRATCSQRRFEVDTGFLGLPLDQLDGRFSDRGFFGFPQSLEVLPSLFINVSWLQSLNYHDLPL